MWFVLGGHGELQDHPDDGIPAYMVQSASSAPSTASSSSAATSSDGLTYSVLRDDGITARRGRGRRRCPPRTESLDAAVVGPGRPVPTPRPSRRWPTTASSTSCCPSPADGDVAAVIDSTAGLSQASAEDRTTRAWEVGPEPNPDAVDGPRSWLRIGLLVLQGVAIVVVAVLCAPTSTRRRTS